MSFTEQAHYNDIGTVFKVTVYDTTSTGTQVVADVSDATTMNFIFRKPNGSTSTKTASFTSDGSDGQIQYVTVDGDLDSVGTWSIQAYIVTPSGKWHTSSANFKVYENL